MFQGYHLGALLFTAAPAMILVDFLKLHLSFIGFVVVRLVFVHHLRCL